MTEPFYRTALHKTDHTTFGGIIYPSDYNTDYNGKTVTGGSIIARRIVSDKKFDQQCRKNEEYRKTVTINKERTSNYEKNYQGRKNSQNNATKGMQV